MKKLILIIAALMLMSCTCGESGSSAQDRLYNDNVTVYNANGEVLKTYDNVKVETGANAEKVYVRTRNDELILVVGGTVIVKFGK